MSRGRERMNAFINAFISVRVEAESFVFLHLGVLKLSLKLFI